MAVAVHSMELSRALLSHSLLAIVVIVTNWGCYRLEPERVDLQMLSQKVTILPESEAKNAVLPCSRKSPSGVTSTWLPTMNDVVSAESRLKAYLASGLSRQLEYYYRQYAGIVINGKRVLLIHAFRLPLPDQRIEQVAPKWRAEYVSVCHGGKVSWGVEYDVESENFANFEMNSGPDHVK